MNLITLGIDKIDPEKFEEVKNCFLRNKPKGGLWTSPENSKWGWKDFVMSENYQEKRYLKNMTLITLKPTAKIYIIKDIDSYLNCTLRNVMYEDQISELLTKHQYIDFEQLSKEYDALWVTEEAIEKLGSIDLLGDFCLGPLNGWDVETVLLFNLDCIESYA